MEKSLTWVWVVAGVIIVALIIVAIVVIRKKPSIKDISDLIPKPKPPVSTETLTIIKATYVCPGGNTFNAKTMDVTGTLSSLISNNSVYIPSPANMNNIFGQSNPNWCGCPNECTHTRLDVRYKVGSTINDVHFADTDSIIINR